MAVMYTANHMKVRAIVALTESGATPLWMSRIRSDIPIYAFTRHEATRRRVSIYRGVYPFIFDMMQRSTTAELYRSLFDRLLELGLVKMNDLVILTKGELSGVQGGTNSMQILKVSQAGENHAFRLAHPEPRAESAGPSGAAGDFLQSN
jgi:pyruvate kinase